VIEMEQQAMPVLVCTHLSVEQCLLAYFRNIPVKECVDIGLPLNTVVELRPTAGGGWMETHVSLLDPERADVDIERKTSFEQSPRAEQQQQPIWCD